MPESIAITCPQHGAVLIPSPLNPGMLECPDAQCATAVSLLAPGAMSPPLTYLEQGAAERHELVASHEAAGFSRSEAMQILCCVVYASIMKDKGNG